MRAILLFTVTLGLFTLSNVAMHTARAAEKALNALPGVTASVSYPQATARVETTNEPRHSPGT